MDTTLEDLLRRVTAFRDARNWAQFHAPRHLAAALSIEAAELQECFLWRDDEGVEALMASEAGRAGVEEEMADVLLYLLLLSDRLGVDLIAAAARKIDMNATKYPVEKSHSSSAKYTEYLD